jgi:polyhydroxyalkanoate synthesis repressor PhaR
MHAKFWARIAGHVPCMPCPQRGSEPSIDTWTVQRLPEMIETPKSAHAKSEVVIIKKYANRRLYNTETSSYVTLEDIAKMVRSDREFHVLDAKSGDDLTHSVLTQIIVEQEGRSGGPALLPIPFLRQLIRFYDDSLARMVPSYLQMSLDTLRREQDRFRAQFGTTWAGTAFESYQDQTRRNLALFEQAMKMWTPFGPLPLHPGAPYSATVPEKPSSTAPPITVPLVDTNGVEVAAEPTPVVGGAVEPSVNGDALNGGKETVAQDDLADLRSQLATMQAQIERLARERGR